LRRFVTNAEEFRDQLRFTHSVILGSAALAFIDRSLTDWSSPYCVKDLDVFCLKSSFLPMIEYFLTQEGYQIDLERNKVIRYSMGSSHTFNTSIASTMCLKKKIKDETRRVKIVECCEEAKLAFRPITEFHSTIVMNWLTADSITVTYPALTFAHRGIIHPGVYEEGIDGRYIVPNEQSGVRKYRERGYKLQ
ncbi:hypothetical protein BD410DRAFT_690650, partial [Rickenella mellea]